MSDGYELDWDGPIENDGKDFVTLPEGDYDFVITDFERGRFSGSDKLPPCNKAVVHIKVDAPEGITVIKHNLFLHSVTEGLLCAFFTSIGQRKHGEKVTMNWNAVIGAGGRCKLVIHRWKNDKGDEFTSNEIKKFYEPKGGPQSSAKGFEPGRF